MNLFDPVSSIMSKDLITLPLTASIADAAKIFKDRRIHHIPVVSDKKLEGLISMSDYLFFKRGFLDDRHDKTIEEIRLYNYDVSYIMTKGIAILEPSQRINVAIEIFKENLFHAIPVVENGELIGIVTTYDIIRQLGKDNEAHSSYK